MKYTLKRFDALTISLLLFILSFLLRLLLISTGPFHVDTLSYITLAQESLNKGYLQSFWGSGYPFTIILAIIFTQTGKILGNIDPVTAFNFSAVLFGSLCIPVLYNILRKITDNLTAILSSIFYSLCPILLANSVYGQGNTPALFFLLMAILFVIKFRETGKIREMIWASVFLGLAGATRAQDLAFNFITISFLFFCKVEDGQLTFDLDFIRSQFKNYLSLIFISGFIAACFYLPYILGPEKERYFHFISLFKKRNLAPTFRISIILSQLNCLIKSLTPPGILCSAIGFLILAFKKRWFSVLLFLWWIVPSFLLLRMYSFSPRFMLFSIIPFIIYIGYLFSYLISEQKKIFAITAVLAFLIIETISLLFILPILETRHENAITPEYVKWVAKTIEKDSYLITIDDSVFFHYYSNVKILTRPVNYSTYTEEQLTSFSNKIDKLLKEKDKIYINLIGLYMYDFYNTFAPYIIKHYNLKFIGTHIYENWHKGSLNLRIIDNPLYRVLPH